MVGIGSSSCIYLSQDYYLDRITRVDCAQSKSYRVGGRIDGISAPVRRCTSDCEYRWKSIRNIRRKCWRSATVSELDSKVEQLTDAGWLGLTDFWMAVFGVMVPVTVGVGGVPETVGVGVPEEWRWQCWYMLKRQKY